MDALRSGNIELSKLLIKFGSDINAVDNLGRHGLHISAELGILSSIQLLIMDYNVDPNITIVSPNGMNGQTPLHWAYKEKQKQAIKLLIELGANISIKDWKNRLPADMIVKKNFVI